MTTSFDGLSQILGSSLINRKTTRQFEIQLAHDFVDEARSLDLVGGPMLYNDEDCDPDALEWEGLAGVYQRVYTMLGDMVEGNYERTSNTDIASTRMDTERYYQFGESKPRWSLYASRTYIDGMENRAREIRDFMDYLEEGNTITFTDGYTLAFAQFQNVDELTGAELYTSGITCLEPGHDVRFDAESAIENTRYLFKDDPDGEAFQQYEQSMRNSDGCFLVEADDMSSVPLSLSEIASVTDAAVKKSKGIDLDLGFGTDTSYEASYGVPSFNELLI